MAKISTAMESVDHVSRRSAERYVRFYDVTGIDHCKEGVKLNYFDLTPGDYQVQFMRGIQSEERLPPSEDEEVEESYDAEDDSKHYIKNFNSKVVSRNHAQVHWTPDDLMPTLIDHKSRHGTYVAHLGCGISLSDMNGLLSPEMKWEKLNAHEPITLRDGDVIQLGKKTFYNDINYIPHRLFVEVSPDKRDTPSKASKCEIVNLDLYDSDDEVVETEDPKKQHAADKKRAEVQKATTLILSDDDESDDYQPDLDETSDAGSHGDGEGTTEDIGNYLNDAESDEETNEGKQIESEDDDEEEMEEKAEEEEESEDSDDDEDEDEYEDEDEELASGDEEEFINFTAKATAEEVALVKEPKLAKVEMMKDANEAREATEKASQEGSSQVETDRSMQKDLDALMLALTEDGAKEEEQDQAVETALTDVVKSSIEDLTSDHKEVTAESTQMNVEMPVSMQEEVTVTEVKTSTIVSDQELLPAQLIGNKRSHDEVVDAETETQTVKSMTTVLHLTTPSSTETIQHPHKKLKTFSVGLATGLVAGMVGTIVGLSSFALSDISFD